MQTMPFKPATRMIELDVERDDDEITLYVVGYFEDGHYAVLEGIFTDKDEEIPWTGELSESEETKALDMLEDKIRRDWDDFVVDHYA